MPQWRLWCKRPKTLCEKEEVIIGAILTQRTNWKNVEIAIKNLKKARLCSLKKIYLKGEKNLYPLIKPAGFFQRKANYLYTLSCFVLKKYKNLKNMKKEKTEILRKELLSLKGIGPETADSILLYALEKPIFVIDEYTRRLAKYYKISKNLSYHHLQEIFEKGLKKSVPLFQDFHALIVEWGKKNNV